MTERSAATRAPALVWFGLLLLCFVQRPGETTFDTKFDLSADPGGFLLRSLHLWNQQSSFGELQNQAYGYLFPQGLFALVGHTVGLPAWVTQRLWMALVLILAFEGARRLWRALAPQTSQWAALVAGLAYATAPRLLGLSGVLSAEILPTAVLPWVVLPLVLAQRGRLGVRAGALLSGAAVLMMGGVNAVEDLAALPLPFLVVASTWRRPGGRRLAGWWALATAAASAWWMLPLLVLGKYSPPFLDYIETSAAVERPLGWTDVTRGADHWLSYVFVGSEPWWPGSYALSTEPLLIVLTGLVAAFGFWGLTRLDMPLRSPLVLSAVLGMVCLTLARPGLLAAPVHGIAQSLLDDALSMFRNVHKVDPLVRLPLALGLGHVVARLLSRRDEARAAGASSRSSSGAASRRRVVVPVAVVGVIALMVLAAAQPLFAGTLRKAGWTRVPSYWTQAADYLGRHADGRATLVLPGAGFGQQTWGWTIDEPMQGVARSPWISRSQVPLTPGATIRFLDGIEERDDDGLGSPKLAADLARSGVGYVLVRRDLDSNATAGPTTARVDKALSRSPGLKLVASFGNAGLLDQAAIDVYRVGGDVPRIQAQPIANVRTLVGGPEDVLTALEAGAVDATQPVLIESPKQLAGAAADVVGDGYRLRERQFGRVHDSVSQMMAPGEPYRIKRAANDYPGVPGVPRVYSRYSGLASVTASTSAGYVDTLGASRPERGPWSAADGRQDTYWQSAELTDPVGQWVQLGFPAPQRVDAVNLVLGVDGVSGVPIRQVRVTAGGRSHVYRVDPTSGVVHANFNGAKVSQLRVTVTQVAGSSGVVAIRDISLPGEIFSRVLVVPDSGADAHTTFVMRARPHRRACVATPIGPSCSQDQGRVSEEEQGIFRQVTVHGAGTWQISGAVTALPTASTASLLAPLAGQVRVQASSSYLGEPGASGQLGYDGDTATDWLADPSDPYPTLRLQWKSPATISRLRLEGAGGDVVTPESAVIHAGDQTRTVGLGTNQLGFFAPLRTRSMTISFPRPATVAGQPQVLGFAEMKIDGLDHQQYKLSTNDPTGALCGLGPEVTVDGTVYPTRVNGTMGNVLDGGPLSVTGCSGPIRLGPGDHQISFRSTEQFQPTALTLAPTPRARSAQLPDRRVRIRSWNTHDRVVQVGSGPRSLLRIPENRNAGWVASLSGHELAPVTVDGWQQGFVLPAGRGGIVSLHFGPDRNYRLGLLAGGLLALALLVGAVVAARREAPSAPMPGAAPPRWRWRGWLTAAVLAGLLGGLGVLLGVVLGLLSDRFLVPPRQLVAPFVALAATAAGLVAFWQPGLPPLWCDAVAAIGVGFLIAALPSRGTDAGETSS